MPVQVMMIHGFVVMARSGPGQNRPVDLCSRAGRYTVPGLPPVYRGMAEDGNGGEYQQYGASGYPFSNPTGANVTGGMNGNLRELPGSRTCRDRIILFRNAGRVSLGECSPKDSHSVKKRRDRVRAGRIGMSSERCAPLSS